MPRIGSLLPHSASACTAECCLQVSASPPRRTCSTNSLARETIRRALSILRQEGLIEVRHGHGTFVVETPPSVSLKSGDSITSSAAITVTRATGQVETYPVGTKLTVVD